MWRTRARLGWLLAAAMAASCDSGEIADIPFGQVQQAANGDTAAFKSYFEGIKGKRVAWQGQVSEARREMEDDYMQTGVLLVDMDAAEHPGADVTFKIPTDRLEEFQPGQPVSFTAVLREYELSKDGLLLKMQMKELK